MPELTFLLPRRVWCDGKKILTQDVTIRVVSAVPSSKGFSKFALHPDEFKLGMFQKPIPSENKTFIFGFIFPVRHVVNP